MYDSPSRLRCGGSSRGWLRAWPWPSSLLPNLESRCDMFCRREVCCSTTVVVSTNYVVVATRRLVHVDAAVMHRACNTLLSIALSGAWYAFGGRGFWCLAIVPFVDSMRYITPLRLNFACRPTKAEAYYSYDFWKLVLRSWG